MIRFLHAAFVLIILLVPAVASASEYRVGPDDLLAITVFDEPDLTGPYLVNGAASIAMPLIGDVAVDGLTTEEVQQKITAALKGDYLINPRVSVQIARYRPFYILGEVRAPGSYSYASDMTALNAIALAGGFTPQANEREIQISRTAKQKLQHEIAAVDVKIAPGDIILVKKR